MSAKTVDETNEFRQFDESFGQAFSKACAVEAGGCLLALRRGRNSPFGVSFCELFLCAYGVKEKVDKEFVQSKNLCIFGIQSEPTRIFRVGYQTVRIRLFSL